MPEESRAADEHALMAEINEPLGALAPEPPGLTAHPDFPVVLRGYDRLAVDAYLRRTSALIADLQSRHSPDAAVRRALERVGEEVAGILQRAHETADEVTAGSRREAEERLETARREAEELTQSSAREAEQRLAAAQRDAAAELARARREAEQIIADARDRLVELDADADRVWGERERIIEDVRGLAQELVTIAAAAAERFPAGTGEGPVLETGDPATDETVSFRAQDTGPLPHAAGTPETEGRPVDPDATRPLPPPGADA